ncbi:hypothetical protein G3I17_17095 [Streptomyces sp. SID13031]|nr:hypothetical protein [Streptomyces sp. SID13031]
MRLSATAGASLLIAASATVLASTQAVAASAEENPVVDVAIDSFSPSAPVPGQAVTITGRITNTSQTTFLASQAIACIERNRLSTADALAAIPAEKDEPLNDRNDCVGLANSESTTFQAFDNPLAPKAAVAFQLVVPWSEWKITSQAGVYTVGVRFRGNVTERDRTTAGLSRILMPVIAKTPMPRKVDAALVLPLRHQPTLLANHLFTNDSLAESMAPTGQLGRLLELGKKRTVTWLVDPAMLDEARTIADSDSYKVTDGPGQTKAGTGRAVIKAWLAAFDQSRNTNPVVLLPYGDPDVASLVRYGDPLTKVVTDSRSLSEQYNLLPPSPGAPSGLWLEGGDLTTKTLVNGSSGFAGERKDDINIVSSSSWSAKERPALLPSPVYNVLTPEGPPRSVPTVIADSALLAGGPDPATAGDPLQIQQRFVAETSLIAGTGTGAASVVVVPPRDWDDSGATSAVAAAMSASPWITPVGINQVVPAEPGTRDVKAPAAPAESTGLPDGQLDDLKDLSDAAATYQELLADPSADTEIRTRMIQGLLRSAASEWVGAPDQARRFLAYQRNVVAAQLKAVKLVSNTTNGHQGIKVNLSGSKGSFPLTVENGLDVTIRISLIVTATGNRDDLRIDPLQVKTLPAGQKGTFQVKASAEQNGVINANAQLITSDLQPIGEAQPLVIQASQYGSVGWILVGAAVALLFGTSIVRIYRRVRSERRDPSGPKPEADALHPEPMPAEDLGQDDPAASPNGVSRPESPAPLAPGQSDLESLKEGVGTKDG